MTGIVVASANGSVGIEHSVDVLRQGGGAVDAVVAGLKLVEANPDDHSVGYSGLPNLLGEVELDASIMDGRGLRAGAVGALQGYQDAAELARQVMEELPHSLIVGAGANRFAREMDLTPVDLLSPDAERIWQTRLSDVQGSDPAFEGADVGKVRALVRRLGRDLTRPREPLGTVNFIARDARGDIACGVSTSGWPWKYPGRLGDSPIIGAGNYADNRWGAAACTGRGEMAIRCCTAHSVVTYMRFGMSLTESLRTALIDLRSLDDPYASEMNIIGLDRDGNHAAASTNPTKTYVFMTVEMEVYEEQSRIHVPLHG